MIHWTSSHGLLWTALLLEVWLVVGEGNLLNCDLQTCHPCFSTSVTCNTTDKNEILPQYLTKKLTKLNLIFITPDSSLVQFRCSHIVRYSALVSLTISGDFSSIEAGAISVLPGLQTLIIKRTSIGHLPDHLLASNRKLTSLILEGNSFQEIPWNIFENSSGIPLKQFTFSRHNQVNLPCSNGIMDLPRGLRNAVNIRMLDLSYNTFFNPECSCISDDFFGAISRLSRLFISGSNLVHLNERILSVLTRLEELDISSLSPYKSCPSSAERLLSNIPNSVKTLHVCQWVTEDELNRTCALTNNSLSGLTKLDHLTTLGFSLSDGIFGPILLRSTIPVIRRLSTLDLTSCRIYSIEKDALNGLPNLSKLILAGNPLGSKELNLLSNFSPSVQTLHLDGTLIRSDDYYQYQVSHLLCNFPNLKVIRFSSNFLKRMPLFIRTGPTCNTSTHQTMSSFAIDGNMITNFAEDHVEEGNICSIFPNLEILYLSQNMLVDLSGLELCTNIRHLQLDHNNLVHFQQPNLSRILHWLNRTTHLNLGYNELHNMDEHLLAGLPLLEEFDATRNRMDKIAANAFRRNPRLKRIRLGSNRIKYLAPSSFDDLPHLEKLDLRDNKLTTISQHLLSIVDGLQMKYFRIETNPFDCDCDKKYFQKWLLRNMEFERNDFLYMYCSSPAKRRGDFVYSYVDDVYDCVIKEVLIITGSIIGGVTIFGVSILFYKYRWYLHHIRIVWKAFRGNLEIVKKEYVCLFDAYVSFDSKSEADSVWVVNELIPAIEDHQSNAQELTSSSYSSNRNSATDTSGQKSLRLYIEQRNAAAGRRIFAQRHDALENSKRILIVLSNSYLKSSECLSDADLAGILMQESDFYQPNRILVLIREELSEEVTRAPISSLLLGKTLKVETEELRKMEMWKEIRKFLSKPLYMYCKPEKSRNQERANAGSGVPDPDTETTPLLIN